MQIQTTESSKIELDETDLSLTKIELRNITSQAKALANLKYLELSEDNTELSLSLSTYDTNLLSKTLYTLLRSKDTSKDVRELCISACQKNLDLIASGLQEKGSHRSCARLLGLLRKSPKSYTIGKQDLKDKAEKSLLRCLNKKPLTSDLVNALGPSKFIESSKQLELVERLKEAVSYYPEDDKSRRGAALALSLYVKKGAKKVQGEAYKALEQIIEYEVPFLQKHVIQPNKKILYYNAEIAIALLLKETETAEIVEDAIIEDLCVDCSIWLETAFLTYDKSFDKLTRLILHIPLVSPKNKYTNPNEAASNFEEAVQKILSHPDGENSICEQLKRMNKQDQSIVFKYMESVFGNLDFIPPRLKSLYKDFSNFKDQHSFYNTLTVLKETCDESTKIDKLRQSIKSLGVEEPSIRIYEFSKACLEQIANSEEGAEWAKLWVDGLNLTRNSLNYRDNPQIYVKPFYELMSKHGLDGPELLSVSNLVSADLNGAWPQSNRIKNLSDVVYKSLKCIYEVNKEIPNGVKYLRKKCGIKVFGRYPSNMLVEQIKLLQKDRSVKRLLDKPCISVYLPISDWNGAFFANQEISTFEKEFTRKRDRRPVIFTESASNRGLLRQMLHVKRRFGETEYAVIGGHGSEEGFTLYKNQSVLVSDLDNDNVKNILRRVFKNGAQIVFVSCKGGVEGGIAETVHKQLAHKQTTIYASSENSSVDFISFKHYRSAKPRLSARFTVSNSFNQNSNSTVSYTDTESSKLGE